MVKHKLTNSQVKLLGILKQYPDIATRDLMALTGTKSRGGMYQKIRSLENRGLIFVETKRIYHIMKDIK